MNTLYEKYISSEEHKIESGNVLTSAKTGRVIAVFYNDYDLDEIIERLGRQKQITRENRYLVIKRSDLRMAESILTPKALEAIETLEKMSNQARANRGKAPLCCVVVESDWPEYEPTWDAIEKRVNKESKS